MASWWKSLTILAGGLVSLGAWASTTGAQPSLPAGGENAFPPAAAASPTDPGPPPGAFMNGPPTGPPCDFPNVAPPWESMSAFEMRKSLPANGFSEKDDSCRPLRWQITADHFFVKFKAGTLPPLATTGSTTNALPGALNQPNTVLLPQPPDPGTSQAFRLGATVWIHPELFSVKSSFFLMEQVTVGNGFQSNSAGTPLLARPYINAVTNQEDADLRSFPGIFRGTISDSVTTRLMGADATLNWHNTYNREGGNISLFGGVRWLRLDERYNSFDTSTTLGGAGFNASFSDTFTTYNQFLGGQVGVDMHYKMGRITFGVVGKVAVGPNYQTILINGQTIVTNQATGASISDAQGLFAQPTNVGRYNSTRTTILPEAEAKISFDITECIRFSVGYAYLYMNNVVRPGDQIDRTVNIQVLQAGATAPLLPGPPSFRQTTFDAQMLTVGLEIRY